MPAIEKILAATKNKNKLKEFNSILHCYGIEVESAYDYCSGVLDIEEKGKTFGENAIIKATSLASAVEATVFADDSGLEVEALNNEPGIYSARYAGEGASDGDRIEKLLHKLGNHKNRAARFVCVIAIVSPSILVGTAEGEIRGTIANSPRGENGFGYDPIFIPKGYDRTFAEIELTEKNRISHRFRALILAYESGFLKSKQL